MALPSAHSSGAPLYAKAPQGQAITAPSNDWRRVPPAPTAAAPLHGSEHVLVTMLPAPHAFALGWAARAVCRSSSSATMPGYGCTAPAQGEAHASSLNAQQLNTCDAGLYHAAAHNHAQITDPCCKARHPGEAHLVASAAPSPAFKASTAVAASLPGPLHACRLICRSCCTCVRFALPGASRCCQPASPAVWPHRCPCCKCGCGRCSRNYWCWWRCLGKADSCSN